MRSAAHTIGGVVLSLLTRVVVPCHNALGVERPLRCVKKKLKKAWGLHSTLIWVCHLMVSSLDERQAIHIYYLGLLCTDCSLLKVLFKIIIFLSVCMGGVKWGDRGGGGGRGLNI